MNGSIHKLQALFGRHTSWERQNTHSGLSFINCHQRTFFKDGLILS